MISSARLITVPVLVVFAFSVFAQTPARPKFEVATIKLNTDCGNGVRNDPVSPGRLGLVCRSSRLLIEIAYKIPKALGGPAWLDSDLYDLNAKAEGNAPLDQMGGPMLQTLLEDRMKLIVHRETRELPVYSLTAARSGAKVTAFKEGSCVPIDLRLLQPTPGEPRPVFCGTSSRTKGPTTMLNGHGVTMENLAHQLSVTADRPVIDKTGLTGLFDFHLELARDAADSTPSDGTAGLSIFTAIKEQLGLELKPDKGPVEVLVVDHVERPSEN